jgi:hypothetical protein
MRLITKFASLGAIAVTTALTMATAADMRRVTSTEIKIGQTMRYNGPVSAFDKGEVIGTNAPLDHPIIGKN